MQPSYEEIAKEIATLKRAARIHAKHTLQQYKRVLRTIEELERQKQILEQKVQERTKSLQEEMERTKQLAKQREMQAKYDMLTNLPNRHYFQIYLEQLFEDAKHHGTPFSIFFVDLDGFKQINDVFGHKAGDVVLQEVARRLKKSVRSSDFVARLGGDEFVIVFPGLDMRNVLQKLAGSILEEVQKEIVFEGNDVSVGASIGIYIYDGSPLEDILVNADIAMYEAKRQGKGRYIFFESKSKEQFQSSFLLQKELVHAYEQNEFISHLQPIVDRDEKIVGAEVLLRWQKSGELVPPGRFIEILENMDLIKDVTKRQLHRCKRCMERFEGIFLSFNISAKVLEGQMLFDIVDEFELDGIDLSRVHFELTESEFVKNIQRAQEVLGELARRGVKILLDDFGTGYSSLSYIRDFHIDILKIDREFVKNIVASQKSRKLFYAIIEMAQALDMEIIVEGIESKEQLELVPKESGIYLQGYYYYKPMPREEFRALLQVTAHTHSS